MAIAPNNYIQTSMIDEEIVCLLDSAQPVLAHWNIKSGFEYPHVKLSILDDINDPITQYSINHKLPERRIGAYTVSLHNQPILLKETILLLFFLSH